MASLTRSFMLVRFLLLAALSPSILVSQAPAEAEARAVALAMPRAIDYADWESFIALFTEDAMMYFPFSAVRANSRAEIEKVMRPIFERNAERVERPLFGFEPSEVEVTIDGTAAVVTWVMDRPSSVARRTAILRTTEQGWKIALVHADTFRK